MSQKSNIEKARESWGETLPDWVAVLAEHCDIKSQAAIAADVGYSTTAVSQVVTNKYPGDYGAVKKAVEGALMGQRINCPVLGPMRGNRCLEHQKTPYSNANSLRVKLYKACRSGCPHSRLEG